jgi:Protein of unknown function (DUF2971)
MPLEQPRKVYRYQAFSATTVSSLCHDKLYFADPGAFNDPHDCKPTVDSDSDNEKLRAVLKTLIKRRVESETLASLRNARVKGEGAEAHAHRSGDQDACQELARIAYNATDPEFNCSEEDAENWLLTLEIQRELLAQYDRGVCCFASAVDNPLLWSHYGDQHRGLCIGYGLNRIPEPKLYKVVYGGSRTIKTSLIARALLENDHEAQDLLDRNVLLRKAPSWRYEREWRLLGKRGAQDSCLRLLEVTFGLRCPNALQHALTSTLEPRGETAIKFYEMYELRGSFKLKRRLVDLDELRAYYPRTAKSELEIFGPVSSAESEPQLKKCEPDGVKKSDA